VRQAWPDAGLSWIEYHRRLLVSWPGIGAGSIWEPNFFSRGEYYTDDHLLNQIVDHRMGQRTQLQQVQEGKA
jgi:hypothetical protein